MRTLLLVGLAGCSSIFGLKAPQGASDASTSGDGGGGDATDAPTDSATDGVMADAQQCFGSGKFAVCFDALPTMPKDLSGTINTNTAAACSSSVHWTDPSQPAACFVVGTTVNVGPLAAVSGPPLVIVATDRVTFSGLVDISSHLNNLTLAAGANPTGCAAPGMAQQNTAGGGGGAGGTFVAAGGNGGDGFNGTIGGTAAAAVPTDVLHGGCPGGAGAKGGGGNPALQGFGGGALYVVAGNAIALGTATIAANGAGASQANNRWGGSGGGAGGMIALYAPTISANGAILVANGGGGSSGTDGGTGDPGLDPDPAMPMMPAAGGNGGTSRPDGGAGFALGSPPGNGLPSPGINISGAGGGGGAGYIRTNVSIAGITASPALDIVP